MMISKMYIVEWPPKSFLMAFFTPFLFVSCDSSGYSLFTYYKYKFIGREDGRIPARYQRHLKLECSAHHFRTIPRYRHRRERPQKRICHHLLLQRAQQSRKSVSIAKHKILYPLRTPLPIQILKEISTKDKVTLKIFGTFSQHPLYGYL